MKRLNKIAMAVTMTLIAVFVAAQLGSIQLFLVVGTFLVIIIAIMSRHAYDIGTNWHLHPVVVVLYFGS